jgi:L-glutamine-phosphate cytidylyltransferase
MKMIIVAAGQGIRLRPLTNNKPKCMVEYNKKPIIDYILDAADHCNIKDIAVVNGYKKEVLERYLEDKGCTFFTNENFDETNMVTSLFNAKEFMNDDLIISYADIVYKPEILKKLMASNADFSVVVDNEWKELWSLRMVSPLEDAETMKIQDGHIIELGKKPISYDEIEGQYIGLMKVSKSALSKLIKFYETLNRSKIYDGKDFNNMYMTSLIQMVIDNIMDVTPVFINGGWIEIDCIEDISAYNNIGIKF